MTDRKEVPYEGGVKIKKIRPPKEKETEKEKLNKEFRDIVNKG